MENFCKNITFSETLFDDINIERKRLLTITKKYQCEPFGKLNEYLSSKITIRSINRLSIKNLSISENCSGNEQFDLIFQNFVAYEDELMNADRCLSEDMKFSNVHLISIMGHVVLLTIAVLANVSLLSKLFFTFSYKRKRYHHNKNVFTGNHYAHSHFNLNNLMNNVTSRMNSSVYSGGFISNNSLMINRRVELYKQPSGRNIKSNMSLNYIKSLDSTIPNNKHNQLHISLSERSTTNKPLTLRRARSSEFFEQSNHSKIICEVTYSDLTLTRTNSIDSYKTKSLSMKTERRKLPPNCYCCPSILQRCKSIKSTLFNMRMNNSNLHIFRRKKITRFQTFVLHLCIADLFIAFFTIPIEIGWDFNVMWIASTFLCRLLAYFRAFGYVLSSFIIILLSLDRYYAITKPLSIAKLNQLSNRMITISYVLSAISCIPQSIIFRVIRHERYQFFTQCSTFGMNQIFVQAYNAYIYIIVYIVPLTVIVGTYIGIWIKISDRIKHHRRRTLFSKRILIPLNTKLSRQAQSSNNSSLSKRSKKQKINAIHLKSSKITKDNVLKAKLRTTQLAVVIVLIFVICWTPYIVVSIWFLLDPASARKYGSFLGSKLMFMFAVANCAANPIVYGVFALRCCAQKKQN
ncbi:hypothetical protein SNEBB_004891 [Seison nebaliae]|nr:hypothetical protein SNEBB_004891 [Seison nebaliae]